jgi:hypothetical protein
MYGNTLMMELECHLRYCIYRHCFCIDYNYVKSFHMTTRVSNGIVVNNTLQSIILESYQDIMYCNIDVLGT